MDENQIQDVESNITREQSYFEQLSNLNKQDPIPRYIYDYACSLKNNTDRTTFLQNCKLNLPGRVREFSEMWNAIWKDYIQKRKQEMSIDNKTCFTDQPMELHTGEWITNDLGVYKVMIDRKTGEQSLLQACSHPLMPVAILKNIDTGIERITLAYCKNGRWHSETVPRNVVANASKIVDALANSGIEVTSENSKYMVKYISDVVGLNQATLEPIKSIGRLGWVDGEGFSPYADNLEYEGDEAYQSIFKSIGECGDFKTWQQEALYCRRNLAVRIMMDAAIASPLLKPLGCLPFVTHMWGTTGGGKTVTLKLCMSIWGNPELGGLVKTLNMTKNAMMRHAAFLHSIPFAGDELQTIQDRWNGNLDGLIMQITEGIDRGRAKAYGGVEETRTWKNAFLFTGEEPITKHNSGGGVKNRVVEIQIEDYVIPKNHGHEVCEIVDANYGHAGKMIIDYLDTADLDMLKEARKTFASQMIGLNTTEKQAMAMSCILVADNIAARILFPGDEFPLQVSDIKHLLKTQSEVDTAARSYEEVISLIARNPIRFADPGADGANRGESWGKIEEDYCYFNKSVLVEQMAKMGFDFNAVSKKWAVNGWLIKSKDGKFTHSTRVYGVKTRFVKIHIDHNDTKLPDDVKEDEDGFLTVDAQQELPFS